MLNEIKAGRKTFTPFTASAGLPYPELKVEHLDPEQGRILLDLYAAKPFMALPSAIASREISLPKQPSSSIKYVGSELAVKALAAASVNLRRCPRAGLRGVNGRLGGRQRLKQGKTGENVLSGFLLLRLVFGEYLAR